LRVAKEACAQGGPFLGRAHWKYQSDNGSEYINEEFDEFIADKGAKFVHSLPYNPTTQGQVPHLLLSTILIFFTLFVLRWSVGIRNKREL
jgi:hypothetical protein